MNSNSCEHRRICLMPVAMLVLLVASVTAQAQIYRCEIDGTTVFSDTPCSIDAVAYASAATVSVIPSAGDLDRTEAANQAFIQARLDRQAAERETRLRRAERSQAAAVAPAPAANRVIILPQVAQAPGHGRYRPHPRHRAGEEEATRQQRFSALSGPWPGSRRPEPRVP